MFKRLYFDQLTTTYFQTFLLWLLAYLTLFLPIRSLNERFMGSVTALLVLAALLGSLENKLPKTSQMKMIDFWFLWYIINIFLLILYHVLLETISCKFEKKERVNLKVALTLPFLIIVFNLMYFYISIQG